MAAIEPQEDKTKHEELQNLLSKIIKFDRHCEVNLKWDGSRWRWTLSVGGIKPDEWNPAPSTQPNNDVPSAAPRTAHRKLTQ